MNVVISGVFDGWLTRSQVYQMWEQIPHKRSIPGIIKIKVKQPRSRLLGRAWHTDAEGVAKIEIYSDRGCKMRTVLHELCHVATGSTYGEPGAPGIRPSKGHGVAFRKNLAMAAAGFFNIPVQDIRGRMYELGFVKVEFTVVIDLPEDIAADLTIGGIPKVSTAAEQLVQENLHCELGKIDAVYCDLFRSKDVRALNHRVSSLQQQLADARRELRIERGYQEDPYELMGQDL